MPTTPTGETASAIQEAIRAKRERKSTVSADIEALEASLLADIEAFDLDAAERLARREQNAQSGAGMVDSSLVFPEIASQAAPRVSKPDAPAPQPEAKAPVASAGGSLLDELRKQAEIRQRELHSAQTARTVSAEAIDSALKHLFFYLHDFVQQLNIVKPGIPRDYTLVDQLQLRQLGWQEGFADYRTQSQAAGALVELVSLSYRLSSERTLIVERDGPLVDRFRAQLFDFGLPFNCKEFKNARRYVERAEFEIRSEVSGSARWRADFDKGVLMLEMRNVERLGSFVMPVAPKLIDQALLDDFGRLILGQPNRFRELARRPA